MRHKIEGGVVAVYTVHTCGNPMANQETSMSMLTTLYMYLRVYFAFIYVQRVTLSLTSLVILDIIYND